MPLEWKILLETLIGSAAGAVAVVSIDYLVKHHLYKIKNFQDAISIQLALHQMLVVSLQMRQHYDQAMSSRIEFYRSIGVNNPENFWDKFRHIDLQIYLQPFDIDKLDWDFTQFLSKKEGKTRDILKYLIPSKLGYQSLINMLTTRNKLLLEVQPLLDQFSQANGVNAQYQNKNLENAISVSANQRLKSITGSYIEMIDSVVEECDKSFLKLSDYIKNNFCNYSPLMLDIKPELDSVLQDIKECTRKS